MTPDGVVEETRRIRLSNGKYATVDAIDFDRVSQYSWHGYLAGRKKKVWRASSSVRPNGIQKTIYIGRVIMNPPPGAVVDHIDGNPLNNRRSNLRICSQAQNCCNRRVSRGRYIGVSWKKANRQWVAQISFRNKPGNKYIGLFKTAREAAVAYNNEAKKEFGEYARLNKV